jgi:hypothetical protein
MKLAVHAPTTARTSAPWGLLAAIESSSITVRADRQR